MENKVISFEGILSGDGECFCIDVDSETYKKFFPGDYSDTLRYRDEWAKETGQPYPEEPWRIYPGNIFTYIKKKIKVTITIEEVAE